VLPAAGSLALVELGVHLGSYLSVENALTVALDEEAARSQTIAVAQSAVTTVGILCGLLLVIFVEPPSDAWVGGDRLSGDWRPGLLALGVGLGYGAILVVPALRSSFSLLPWTAWHLSSSSAPPCSGRFRCGGSGERASSSGSRASTEAKRS
jgi:cation-transporting ATPase E